MDPRDIRTWAANHRAAADREAAEARRHPMSAEKAFRVGTGAARVRRKAKRISV